MKLITIEPTADPLRFRLPVTPQLSVGHPDSQFLFGGSGLGAALASVETATARPTVWAAAQYLSYSRPGTVLDLEVVVPVSGKGASQARVTARDGMSEILTVNVALGEREGYPTAQWVAMPDAPAPDTCPPMTYDWTRLDDDANGSFDQRIAHGRFGKDRGTGGPSTDGIARMWVRPRHPDVAVDRVTLAMMADFLPSAVGNALGASAGGNSLDNTIRFSRLVPTRWVLADMRIHSAAGGFIHGRVHLFAEDGTLLATASQSLILRM